MTTTRHTKRRKTRYGLAVFASGSDIGLSAYAASEAGVLTPISEDELREKAPEWHAVLLFCRAARKVQRSVGNLPPQIQRDATIMVQVTALFGGFDDSPLLTEPSQADSGQT